MADIDDVKLEKTAPPPPPPQPRWIPILGIIVLVIALGAVWYYFQQESDLDTAAGQRPAVPAPGEGRIAEPQPVDLPPLDESDAFVRDMVGQLSQHPVVMSLLATDGLIRTFAVSMMNIADGDTPSRHLNTIKPERTFAVRKQRTQTVISPESYARYDTHAAAISGLDAAGVAKAYNTLKPRIQEALREVRGSNADIDRTMERAIVQLLSAPVVEGDVVVVQDIVGYSYADPTLASLSRAQQQLVRMGPENTRRVQQKLREVAAQLGIDPSSLPPERVIGASR
ncbi:MAG TPA: DUF3014 domain-containing protein [Vicinamibacterales bacterium]